MHARRRTFGTNCFDAAVGQRLQEVPEHFHPPADEGGGETPPEHPARALQHALPLHVVGPFVRTVVLVAVALDRKPSVVVSLYHHVDAVLPNSHLWRHPVATLRELIVHLAFERGLATFAQILYAHLVLPEGHRKVSNETAPQPVRRAQVPQLYR